MSDKIHSYKDLIIWKKAMELNGCAYALTNQFPKEEIFGLTSQLKRASLSVGLNVAEGWGRKTTKMFIHFLWISHGSLMEVEACLLYAENLKFISPSEVTSINNLILELSKMIQSLINKLELKLKKSK